LLVTRACQVPEGKFNLSGAGNIFVIEFGFGIDIDIASASKKNLPLCIYCS
jgi:hypothetical protein